MPGDPNPGMKSHFARKVNDGRGEGGHLSRHDHGDFAASPADNATAAAATSTAAAPSDGRR